MIYFAGQVHRALSSCSTGPRSRKREKGKSECSPATPATADDVSSGVHPAHGAQDVKRVFVSDLKIFHAKGHTPAAPYNSGFFFRLLLEAPRLEEARRINHPERNRANNELRRTTVPIKYLESVERGDVCRLTASSRKTGERLTLSCSAFVPNPS
ncbi:hypothetical protein EVAR_49282_1 [Eumeta japonica]|uniref:Uncharacterized protein n=1 Tax=Eumeta variegata TaxID=151549 RepID=A0A4C1XKQ7_EUMVA|nr:hypothetical protein EVAR_49282_1 [Eumeta japonica]